MARPQEQFAGTLVGRRFASARNFPCKYLSVDVLLSVLRPWTAFKALPRAAVNIFGTPCLGTVILMGDLFPEYVDVSARNTPTEEDFQETTRQ